ncbi:MAG: DNA replication/repair protein RecF [Alphaproteobacteria bacterium]|mgnify:FL=1|nr:DNA replication/repair protein RecF [Porticoccaceae bacterium]MDP4925122.1 DNA replication/repair protein RecF [Alphaproteobacteria bacterium]
MTSVLPKIKPVVALEVDNANASKRSWLSRLKLDHFRNYQQADLTIHAGQLVILGDNGAGKTNLLEAVSLLAPGRGMRRSRTEHLAYRASGFEIACGIADNDDADRLDWAVAATLENEDGTVQIGTGVPPSAKQGNRIMRLEGVTVSQADLGSRLAVSWLTPQMDGIFLDSPAARRRFIDRLVIAFDPAHIGRMSRYEKALRQRAHLLTEQRGDDSWFSALESILAETAVAVTAARQSLIKALNQEAACGWFGFPGVELLLGGNTENWLSDMPALAVEDQLMLAARTARLNGDLAMPGPHASEFQALHLASQVPANRASTGQQKAMLIAVILAHARLQDRRLGRVPVMLFDDVAAHLDAKRRSALFDAVQSLGGQCWYSGTDDGQFKELSKTAQFVKILPAKIAGETPIFEVI